MGRETFSVDAYRAARIQHNVTSDTYVTRHAEAEARRTGTLSYIVDPAKGPMGPVRESKIRLDPYGDKWIATVGCPMDIEVTCDTTGSMGGEVDTEMQVLPDLYASVAQMLPGYDPQLCLGIFGDCEDPFVMCRPQFEMEAGKIVEYLKEMAPQRGGHGNGGEDPQYAMLARAYLTNAYTNRIGLKGYHFVVTDEPCHFEIEDRQIIRIFGEDAPQNELREIGPVRGRIQRMVKRLKEVTHQFVLVVNHDGWSYDRTQHAWEELVGTPNVIAIRSTWALPAVISAIIGLTEGTLALSNLKQHLGEHYTEELYFDLGALEAEQETLRSAMLHPVPKKGDIFRTKEDTWPIQPGDPDYVEVSSEVSARDFSDDGIVYL